LGGEAWNPPGSDRRYAEYSRRPAWQEERPAGRPDNQTNVSTGHLMARGLRNLLETVAPAIIIALVINLFLAQATRVYGQSMEPNLHSEQRLVVEKLSYNKWFNVRTPQRGDVVVIRVDGSPDLLIKRVVGLPGDRVEVQHGQVLINGVVLDEPYVVGPTVGQYGPVDVPPLNVFVLGDNRNFSNDSRSFGSVPLENVVGRAWFSYWPPDSWGPVR
jgi:signal peptidase I